MEHKPIFRGLLSAFLTGVLFLCFPAGAAAREKDPWNLYFGLLHAHTAFSDGAGTVEEAFAAAEAAGLDFFAVTDHSNSFDNANSGAIDLDGTAVSQEWARGKAAAEGASGADFVGIFGYEMTWRDSDGLGHINTFATPGWISRNQEGFETLTDYYDALAGSPDAVSQFNHPEMGDFEHFSHCTPAYDGAISLLEVGGEQGYTGCDSYEDALDQGWHVAPTISHNDHRGQWVSQESRTVILSRELTEESLYDALRQRRVYATEDRDLQIRYSLNGQILGSVTAFAEDLTITVDFSDPTDNAFGTVEVRSGGETVARQTVETASGSLTFSLPGKGGYYYLKITQPDGDVAVTAPVWVEEASAPEETEPTEPKPTLPEETDPGIPEDPPVPALPEPLMLRPRFGLLHSHSVVSGGKETAEDLFSAAARTEGLDFFALTDVSHAFDNALHSTLQSDGCAISRDWAEANTAADAVTTDAFIGLVGFEMAWPDDRNLGHITTFATSGWISRNREGFGELTDYYDALAQAGGSVSQFNHPGPDVGEFEDFRHHRAAYDNALTLLEIGDGENTVYYDRYIRALDRGWHVAPTAGEAPVSGPMRTVLLTEDLSRDSLLNAMAWRRAYTTEDPDFSLYFALDDIPIGGITGTQDSHTLMLSAADPTDPEPVQVQVITDGGDVAASGTCRSGETLELTVPGGGSYYFLRLTQADGDLAVTAPVWTDSYEDAGISRFSADTGLPVQGQTITLTAEIFNEETVPFLPESILLRVNGAPLSVALSLDAVDPGETQTLTIPYTHDLPGVTEFQLEISGTLAGQLRSFQESLTLSFRALEMVSGIMVECGCSGLSGKDFQNLTALAARDHMQLRFFSGDLPDQGDILILPPPKSDYSPEFLQQVKIFCARGGTLVVCGCSADENPLASGRLNRLLNTIGSSLCLQEDTALDPVHNGGEETALFPTVIHRKDQWCAGIEAGAFYVHENGCTLAPGDGTWLVKGEATAVSSLTGQASPVLLAWEELPRGGCVFAAGSLFLSDPAMPLPRNQWEVPRVNVTITEAILGVTRIRLPLTSIAQVRKEAPGTLCRIRGYATSGTSNPHTTFPGTLYVQDDTGGIPLVSFPDGGIQVGQSIDAVGYPDIRQGNPVLVLVDYQKGEQGLYRYVPETLNHSRAMDFDTRGGQLLQVEAEVTAVTLTEDGLGVKRFTLRDAWGDEATVLIEDYIRSGAYGTNTLADQVKIGRTVRAMGLLHLDENGIPVLRVRNCEEVVWVPPVPRPDARDPERERNPYTGDPIPGIFAAGTISLLAAVCLLKKQKRSA